MKIILILVLVMFSGTVNAQVCGFEHIENSIERNPEAKRVRDSLNIDLYNWLKTDQRSRLHNQRIQNPYNNLPQGKNPSRSLCGYDNDYQGWADAPTVVGNILTAYDVFGGDYFTVVNMQANRTYRISTCGQDDFDTQITVYPEGGGFAVGHNDDACANYQSEILFSPTVSGNYDILLDEYNCTGTALYTDVEVELIYENRPVYTIPVVFHVVYNNAAENLSDAIIYEQLDILNEHFLRVNLGLSNVPAAFRGQSASPLIQFCLAEQDPNGNTTTGITRTSSTAQVFPLEAGTYCGVSNCLFNSNMHGKTEWDKNQYLNIWVADLHEGEGGISYPRNPEVGVDLGGSYMGRGIAMDYQYFGTNHSSLLSANNLGRVLVHEAGHFFNLFHIWHHSDPNVYCGTDSVSDTPPQQLPTSSSAQLQWWFENDDCSPNYPGIMYFNHMDYSGDQYKELFTYYQTARMDYALFNWYQSLIDSDGCNPGITTGILENNLFDNETIITNTEVRPPIGIDKIRVFDLSGKLILEQGNVSRVDVSGLTQGFYILQNFSEHRVVGVRRIVVQ